MAENFEHRPERHINFVRRRQMEHAQVAIDDPAALQLIEGIDDHLRSQSRFSRRIRVGMEEIVQRSRQTVAYSVLGLGCAGMGALTGAVGIYVGYILTDSPRYINRIIHSTPALVTIGACALLSGALAVRLLIDASQYPKEK